MSTTYLADPSSLPDRADVVVIGAGWSGLSAANTLTRAGRSVVVLEASNGVGGRVRTDTVDGYRLDRGFQVLLTAYPEVASQLDLDAVDFRRFEPGAVIMEANGRFMTVGDPLRRPRTVVDTVAAPVGTVLDKARILTQRLRLQTTDPKKLLRRDDITTEAALEEQGFSRAFIDRFFRPLVGGIQLDPSLTTSRRMFDVILRSLVVGDVGVPNFGMGDLSEQLARRLPPGTVHLNRPVTAVAPGRITVGESGEMVEAGAVVVATEGPAASDLLGLPAVESNPATCVWYGLAARMPEPLNKPYVILDPKGPALNLAVMSAVAPGYAPAGCSLLAAAVPGEFDPDAEPRVRAQLRRHFTPLADQLQHLRTDAIAHGQPRQYPPFAPKQRVSLGDGLFVCGDHRDTASLQGALYSGRRCAEAVLASLG